jgi:hypothetical protein
MNFMQFLEVTIGTTGMLQLPNGLRSLMQELGYQENQSFPPIVATPICHHF